MKKITTMFVMLAICAATFAQDKAADANVTKINGFKEGSSLSANDLGFLNLVSTGPSEKTRGHATETKEVTVSGSKYTAGQKLTKEDADKINKAVAEYNKTHKDAVETKPGENKNAKSRGSVCYYYYCSGGYCYYYYYYC